MANAKVLMSAGRLQSRLSANKPIKPVWGNFTDKSGKALPDLKTVQAHTDRNKNSLLKPGYHTRRNFDMAWNGYTRNGVEATMGNRVGKAIRGAHRYMWEDANTKQKLLRNGIAGAGIIGVGAAMNDSRE